MAIVLPQQLLGPFGGPAWGQNNAISSILQGILQQQRQKKQSDELSSMFSQGNENSPSFTGPPQQQNIDRKPMSGGEFVDYILSNPRLDPQTKAMAINAMKARSAMNLDEAQAESLGAKQEKEKNIQIEYWKPDGSPGGKVMVPESKYNQAVEQIQKAGYVVNEVKSTNNKGEFERILDKTDWSEKKKQAMMGKWIEKQTGEKPGKDAINDFSVFYRGFSGQNPELQGKDLDYAASKAWMDRKILEASAVGSARGEGYAKARTVQVLDTKNGNAPIYISAADVIKANQEEPGRYIAATQGAKALTRTALIEDIHGTINNVRESMQAMPDFTAGQRAKIAIVMRDPNTQSALSTFLAGSYGQTLTPDQQNYLIDLAQLKENAMAMRSVLGAGQGSDDLRKAITATLPGPATPNKEYGLKQLDKFEQVLNRLSKGIPQVPLRDNVGQPQRPMVPVAPQNEITADDYLKKFGGK
jgi:hypothetical protein